MQGLYDFLVEPLGSRYNNVKKVGDQELILNTEIFNHQYVNRHARVLAVPKNIKTELLSGKSSFKDKKNILDKLYKKQFDIGNNVSIVFKIFIQPKKFGSASDGINENEGYEI